MPSEFNNKPMIPPDITLSGTIVDKICQHLTNPTILVKGSDNNMHPFVDPNPILAILQEAINETMRSKVDIQSSEFSSMKAN
jgi:hypothetical protein